MINKKNNNIVGVVNYSKFSLTYFHGFEICVVKESQ